MYWKRSITQLQSKIVILTDEGSALFGYTVVMRMFKIDNELKSANIPRTVRFTEPLFEKLNTIASENNVSFNALVLQCCKYALDNLSEEK